MVLNSLENEQFINDVKKWLYNQYSLQEVHLSTTVIVRDHFPRQNYRNLYSHGTRLTKRFLIDVGSISCVYIRRLPSTQSQKIDLWHILVYFSMECLIVRGHVFGITRGMSRRLNSGKYYFIIVVLSLVVKGCHQQFQFQSYAQKIIVKA